jgi:hypothetical protein
MLADQLTDLVAKATILRIAEEYGLPRALRSVCKTKMKSRLLSCRQRLGRSRDGKMTQFYISNDSEADVQRCNESRDTRLPITITGLTRDGFVKEFRGVVQSVEHYPKRDAGTRFRVTISDS